MSQLIRRVDDIFAAPLNDTLLILNVSTGKYHGLNAVAGRIWELLAEPMTEAQLIAHLLTEFEVDADDCLRDVATCISGFLERELIILG